MYQATAARQEQQAREDAQKAYQSDEELKRQFEEWKRGTFTQYNKEAHDEFLKNRYYKFHQAKNGHYDPQQHFQHSNNKTGPESYQEQHYKESGFGERNVEKEPLSQFYRRKAEDQESIN